MKYLFLIFGLLLTTSLALADKNCKAYKVYMKRQYARQLSFVGYVNEHGIAISNHGKPVPHYSRCFFEQKFKHIIPRNSRGNHTSKTIVHDLSCKCVAYSGFNEEHLANLIAKKLTVKINREHSKNIEETVTKTFLLHSELVEMLKSFVTEILDLQK